MTSLPLIVIEILFASFDVTQASLFWLSHSHKGVDMFGKFKRDPQRKIKALIKAKYEESVRLQRNGKLREYGAVMVEIEALEAQLKQGEE
jgi:hypothetical protein